MIFRAIYGESKGKGVEKFETDKGKSHVTNVWIEKKLQPYKNVYNIAVLPKSPSPTKENFEPDLSEAPLSPKRIVTESADGDLGRGKRTKIENSIYHDHDFIFEPRILDFGNEEENVVEDDGDSDYDEIKDKPKALPKRNNTRCNLKYKATTALGDRFKIPKCQLAMLICAMNL